MAQRTDLTPRITLPPGVPVVPAVDGKELRDVMGMFATGVTVVTAGRDNPHGMTANAFTSVSLEPPMVLVCVVRTAVLHQTVIDSGGFAISVMSARQGHVAKYFASRSRPRDETEFNGVDWAPGPHTGAPVLGGNLAWLECELTAVYDGGDHSIFLGTVLDLGRSGGEDALLFLGGSFYEFDADKQ